MTRGIWDCVLSRDWDLFYEQCSSTRWGLAVFDCTCPGVPFGHPWLFSWAPLGRVWQKLRDRRRNGVLIGEIFCESLGDFVAQSHGITLAMRTE